MRTIEIMVGKGSAEAKLDDRNPGIREALWEILPMEARANFWGEEVLRYASGNGGREPIAFD